MICMISLAWHLCLCRALNWYRFFGIGIASHGHGISRRHCFQGMIARGTVCMKMGTRRDEAMRYTHGFLMRRPPMGSANEKVVINLEVQRDIVFVD
jgi:hypothetical protein